MSGDYTGFGRNSQQKHVIREYPRKRAGKRLFGCLPGPANTPLYALEHIGGKEDFRTNLTKF
jgi:hypothetical protein